jgi:hypothetical protein
LAEIKSQWRLGNTRVHRPWITEPGLWLQYDFADGPMVAGRRVVLLVAWLAWSRYRVVIALRDRTAPSVFAGLDRIFRILGGAPTYLLTDNEKTVTTGHIAGVPVRNRAAVTFGRYYGISVLTCEPADPASKSGVENAVKLAKADIVPQPPPSWTCRANTAQAAKDTHPAGGRCAAHKEQAASPGGRGTQDARAQGRRVVDSPGQWDIRAHTHRMPWHEFRSRAKTAEADGLTFAAKSYDWLLQYRLDPFFRVQLSYIDDRERHRVGRAEITGDL